MEQQRLESTLRRLVTQREEDGDLDYSPFYLVDLAAVHGKCREWKECFPSVEPHYAVKCNPDLEIMRTLAKHGAGFDCASKAEISACLSLGVTPDRIIYANPCKSVKELRYAREQGVTQMTFDNEDELFKIAQHHPEAVLLLRISTQDTCSKVALGNKFGADLDTCPLLIYRARQLGLNLAGVSFHVGSGCYDVLAYAYALKDARTVFDMAETHGFRMSVLDIGGGFPGGNTEDVSLRQIASVVNPVVSELFPDSVRVVSEPGRFFVAECHTLVANVISSDLTSHAVMQELPASKSTSGGEVCTCSVVPASKFQVVTINEGVYGSFKDSLLINEQYFPHVLSPSTSKKLCGCTSYPTSIWGPTGHHLDCIAGFVTLPRLVEGSWLYFQNMGAYTVSLASTSVGHEMPGKVYVDSRVFV